MGKKLQEYINGLTGDEEDRVIRALKKRAFGGWPLTHFDQIRLGFEPPPPMSQPYSAAEARILDAHAAAVATLAEARLAWETAVRDVEKARSRRNGSADNWGSREPSPGDMAEVERLNEIAGDLKGALDAADAAEVAARPHNAGRRRRPHVSVRGLVGAFVGRPQ